MSNRTVKYRLTADTSDFVKNIRKAKDELESLPTDAQRSVSKASDNMTSKVSSSMKSIIKAGANAADTITSNFAKAFSNISSIASDSLTTASGLVSAAFTGVLSKGVSQAQGLENTYTQMIGLTHSVEAANSAYSQAVTYFKNNPFQRDEVINATKYLLQFGAGVQEISGLLDTLGKVSLTSGASIDELAYTYQRAMAQGRITNQDLELFLSRGIDIYGELGRVMNKSIGEVREAASDGKVSLQDFAKAFQQAADPLAMEKFQQTLSRQMDRFKGRISNLGQNLVGYYTTLAEGSDTIIDQTGLYKSLVKMVTAFNDAFNDGQAGQKLYASLDKLGHALAPLIDKITDKIPTIIEKISDAVGYLADNTELLLPIVGGTLVLFGKLGSNLPGVAGIVGNVSKAFGSLWHGILPGIGAGSSGGLLKDMIKSFTTITAIMAVVGLAFNKNEMPEFFAELTGTFSQAKQVFSSLLPTLREVAQILGQALLNCIRALLPVLPPLVEAFSNLAIAFARAVANIAPAVFQALATVLQVIANVINSIPPAVLTAIVEALLGFAALSKVATVLSPVGKALESIASPLTKLGQSAGANQAAGGAGNLVAGILKPLGNPEVLKGAASAALIATAFTIFVVGIGMASATQINVGNLAACMAAIVIVTAIFTLLGFIGELAFIGGVAAAAIGVGLLSATAGLSYASQEAGNIDIDSLMNLMGAITIVSIILTLVSAFAAFGAIGAIASAVIGGGLALAALGLKAAGENAKDIDAGSLFALSGIIAGVSIILGLVSGFAVFGAVAAIASTIIAGGLVLTAIGLREAGNAAHEIDKEGLGELVNIIAGVSTILTLISAFAIFGAVASIATSIIAGGLVLAAIGLKEAANTGKEIDESGLEKLLNAIAFASIALTTIIGFSIFGAVGSILASVMGGGLLVAAKGLMLASKYGSQIDDSGLDKLSENLHKLAGVFTALTFEGLLSGGGMAFAAAAGNTIAYVALRLYQAGIIFKAATSVFDTIKTDNLLKKFNDIEKAISRDGQGWPLWWAIQFKKYIMTISGEGTLQLVETFINDVQTWETDKLLDRFNQFENAVSRHGEGWPVYWADQFKTYIKKLTGDGNLSLVEKFISNILSWPTEKLFARFNQFENAVSRNGQGWPEYWANQFHTYIKKLTGDGNLSLVKDFINQVIEWPTDKLYGKLNDFENAISRNGNGWPENWANSFKTYIDKLAGSGSLELVEKFINNVLKWNVAELDWRFTAFIKAVDRNGQGWPEEKAEAFKNYIEKLTGDGKLDMVQTFIDKVLAWKVTELLERFNEFAKAVSRNDEGWDTSEAEEFGDYIWQLTGDDSLTMVTTFIDKVLSWDTANLGTKLGEFQKGTAIEWDMKAAEKFNEYITKLAGDSSLTMVTSFIDKVLSWEVSKLQENLRAFNNAIKGPEEGQTWNVKDAESFVNYVNKLASIGETTNFTTFITSAAGWNLENFGKNLSTLSKVVSGGEGEEAISWNVEKATAFVSFINKLAEIKAVDTLNSVVTAVIGLPEGLGDGTFNKNLSAIGSAIEKEDGWNVSSATTFVQFWNEFAKLSYDFSSAKTMIETLSGLDASGLADAMAAISTATANILNIFDTLAVDIGTSGTNAVSNYTSAFKNLPSQINEITSEIKKAFGDSASDIEKAAKSASEKFESSLKTVVKAASSIATSIPQQFNAINNAMHNSGSYLARSFVSGLVNGLRNSYWTVYAATRLLAEAAKQGISVTLSIHSPSKEMFKLGSFISEGLVDGMMSQAKQVSDAATELANTIARPFDEINDLSVSLSGEGNGINSGNNISRTNNVNLTNNIYSDIDMATVQRQLFWEISRA